MSTPATRSLEAVLRSALDTRGELRVIAAEYSATPPPDHRYASVIVNGATITVPNLNGMPPPAAGSVAYLLADDTRLWCLGTVTPTSSGGGTGPAGPAGPAGPTGPTGPAGPAGTAAYVTTLPASPVDGQEVCYGADPAGGVIWRLRYRAASASAYKWEFVGGAALFAEDFAAVGPVTSSSYIDMGNAFPVTVPLAGDYQVAWGARMAGATATAVISAAIKVGAAATVDANALDAQPAGANYYAAGQSSRSKRINAVAAAAVLKMQHKVNVGSMTVAQRWLEATPIRVA